jgi:hypothetical protein
LFRFLLSPIQLIGRGLLLALGAIAAFVGLPVWLVGAIAAALAGAAYLIWSNWDLIKAKGAALWNFLKTSFAAGVTWLLAPVRQLWTWLSAMFTAGSAALTSAASRIWPGIKGIFATGLAWFAGLHMRFFEAGMNIGRGLINGIGSMFGALKSKIMGLGKNAVGWFKGVLGIKSPSRVFAGLGGDIMAGLSIGLDRGAGGPLARIRGAGRDLARTMAAATVLAAPAPSFALPPPSFTVAPVPIERETDRTVAALRLELQLAGDRRPVVDPRVRPAERLSFGGLIDALRPLQQLADLTPPPAAPIIFDRTEQAPAINVTPPTSPSRRPISRPAIVLSPAPVSPPIIFDRTEQVPAPTINVAPPTSPSRRPISRPALLLSPAPVSPPIIFDRTSLPRAPAAAPQRLATEPVRGNPRNAPTSIILNVAPIGARTDAPDGPGLQQPRALPVLERTAPRIMTAPNVIVRPQLAAARPPRPIGQPPAAPAASDPLGPSLSVLAALIGKSPVPAAAIRMPKPQMASIVVRPAIAAPAAPALAAASERIVVVPAVDQAKPVQIRPPSTPLEGAQRAPARSSARAAPSFTFTGAITIKIEQQPGEDGNALARRVMSEFEQRARAEASRRASSYEDRD